MDAAWPMCLWISAQWQTFLVVRCPRNVTWWTTYWVFCTWKWSNQRLTSQSNGSLEGVVPSCSFLQLWGKAWNPNRALLLAAAGVLTFRVSNKQLKRFPFMFSWKSLIILCRLGDCLPSEWSKRAPFCSNQWQQCCGISGTWVYLPIYPAARLFLKAIWILYTIYIDHPLSSCLYWPLKTPCQFYISYK